MSIHHTINICEVVDQASKVHSTINTSELGDQATLDQVHLTVCITEYKQCFNIYNYYSTHKTIDEAKQELINIIFNYSQF